MSLFYIRMDLFNNVFMCAEVFVQNTWLRGSAGSVCTYPIISQDNVPLQKVGPQVHSAQGTAVDFTLALHFATLHSVSLEILQTRTASSREKVLKPVHDFRLLPRCTRYLRSSKILCSVDW